MTDAVASATRLPFGLVLARLGHEATAGFRRALKPLDLGAQQFIVVKQLQVLGPTSQGCLADALGLDYSNLAGVVGDLVERGLVERSRDEADRRKYVLQLSAAGEELLADADRAILDSEEQLLADLDEDERAQLWELLRRVADGASLCPAGEAKECAEVCLEEESSA